MPIRQAFGGRLRHRHFRQRHRLQPLSQSDHNRRRNISSADPEKIPIIRFIIVQFDSPTSFALQLLSLSDSIPAHRSRTRLRVLRIAFGEVPSERLSPFCGASLHGLLGPSGYPLASLGVPDPFCPIHWPLTSHWAETQPVHMSTCQY